MILFKNLSPSNFQFSKIITESFSLTVLSNNDVWFWKMMDLDSKGSGIKIDQEFDSDQVESQQWESKFVQK